MSSAQTMTLLSLASPQIPAMLMLLERSLSIAQTPRMEKKNGRTCLHQAVLSGQTDFVKFVLTSQQLRKLVNMRDGNGQTALHLSVKKCMPEMLKALLHHHDIDVTVPNSRGSSATWLFDDAIISAKSSKWVCYLLYNMACPKYLKCSLTR